MSEGEAMTVMAGRLGTVAVTRAYILLMNGGRVGGREK